MNTLKIARRAATAAVLSLTLCYGVASTMPVYANCGTQNGGPTCGKQAQPAPPEPAEAPENPEDGILIWIVNSLSAWIF